MDKKARIIQLLFVAIILSVLTLFSPWFSVGTVEENIYGQSQREDWGLFGITQVYTDVNGSIQVSAPYSNEHFPMSVTPSSPIPPLEKGEIANRALLLTATSMIWLCMVLLLSISIMLIIFDSDETPRKPLLKKLIPISAGLSLGSVFFFLLGFPMMTNMDNEVWQVPNPVVNGIMGTGSVSVAGPAYNVQWAPAMGLILAMVVAVLCLAMVFLLRETSKNECETPKDEPELTLEKKEKSLKVSPKARRKGKKRGKAKKRDKKEDKEENNGTTKDTEKED